MKTILAVMLLVGGCDSTHQLPRMLPDVGCALQLAEPFVLDQPQTKADGVVCVPPSAGRQASWAAPQGSLALLAATLQAEGEVSLPSPRDRVALLADGGATQCADWTGKVDWKDAGDRWQIDFDLECVGSEIKLVGIFYGDRYLQ